MRIDCLSLLDTMLSTLVSRPAVLGGLVLLVAAVGAKPVAEQVRVLIPISSYLIPRALSLCCWIVDQIGRFD